MPVPAPFPDGSSSLGPGPIPSESPEPTSAALPTPRPTAPAVEVAEATREPTAADPTAGTRLPAGPALAFPTVAEPDRRSPDELAGLRAASLAIGVPTAEPARPARCNPAATPSRARRRRRARWRRLLARLRLSARVGFGGLVAYVLLFSFSVVRGSSMRPGIEDGDRILIDPLTPALFGIERGDVVVLRCPLDPSLDYIKRVVGLPGDRIVLEEGRLFVNGVEVSEPYVAEVDRRSRVRTTVREGHYFVLGDNRPHSSDSREFGQVPADLLRGTVEVRVWPPERIGRIR